MPNMQETGSNARPILEVRGLAVRYGGIAALDDLSFSVPAGTVYGVIGPNGAGKTTLFNCLSRLASPSAGDILLDGSSIVGLPPQNMASVGIGRTFQNVALFRELTVLDNVKIGSHARSSAGFIAAALRLPSAAREEEEIKERAYRLLRRFDLERFADDPCAKLPFGIQKRVEMARAMASLPRILLLDEPAAGLSHEELQALISMIEDIRRSEGTTIMLVEHNVAMVMALCDRVVTLNFGRRIAEGTPSEVRTNPAVISAYLGTA